MAEDYIYVVTSTYIENNYSGDVADTVAPYIEDVYGSDYNVFKYKGYDVPDSVGDSPYDVQVWWEDRGFTDDDKNLLLISVAGVVADTECQAHTQRR